MSPLRTVALSQKPSRRCTKRYLWCSSRACCRMPNAVLFQGTLFRLRTLQRRFQILACVHPAGGLCNFDDRGYTEMWRGCRNFAPVARMVSLKYAQSSL